MQLLFPHDADTYALRVSARVTTEEFERYAPIDEQMDFHEKLRLLYVACTRARDHLVVSVHRPAKEPAPTTGTTWTHAELLWDAARGAPGWDELVADAADDLRPAPPTPRRPRRSRPRRGTSGSRRATARATRRGAAGACRPPRSRAMPRRLERGAAADPGLAKGPRDLELPPWNKGRYGTALGRAVHAVLQTVDLATGARLDDAAAAQAAAEGVLGREDDDRRRCARVGARRRDVVREAVRARRSGARCTSPRRSTASRSRATSTSSTARPDGLVVVDYKTDAWRDDADLDAKVARYRLQGASYAVALEAGDGEPVARCVFVFLGDATAPTSVAVSDLPAAMREVRAALAASSAGATTPALPRSGR